MGRNHRYLKDGEITVMPFTPEEEAIEDQREVEQLARQAQEADPTNRIAKLANSTSDTDVVQFKMMFQLANSIRVLEGKLALTKAQYLTFLESQLD